MIRRSVSLSRPCHPCGLDLSPAPHPVPVVEGRSREALETGRSRLVVAGLGFALAFFLIAVRLADVGLAQPPKEPSLADVGDAPFTTGRADITDRNGTVLATTLPVLSLSANTALVRQPARLAARLAAVLPDADEAELFALLSKKNRHVELKRQLTPREAYTVNRLGEPALAFARKTKRVYPLGALTAHIVGMTDVDNNGIAGMERAMDRRLRENHAPLPLSIDLRFQHALADSLQQRMTMHKAKTGAGIVLDVESGEVLASVSLPSYDPSAPKKDDPAQFNTVSQGVYELGSIFKTLTIAMALEAKVARLQDRFDARKPIEVGSYTIDDFHPQRRVLSVPEIFIHSSNIGAAHLVNRLGQTRQRAYLQKLGLLQRASVELPETEAPIVPNPWRRVNSITISYGYGLSVSPLQAASAMAATVNGGIFRNATFLASPSGTPGERVFSEDTSAALRYLLRLNVLRGSGRRADVPGYLVGGKTGTAEKSVKGGYNKDRRLTSFVAAFPMDHPRYLVLVMLDDPKPTRETGGEATAGLVAAPTVRALVSRLGPLMGIEPVAAADGEAVDRHLVTIAAGGQTHALR